MRRSLLSALLAFGFAPLGFALSVPATAGEVTVRQEDLMQVLQGIWVAEGLEIPAPDPDLPLVGEGVPRGAATLLRRAGAAGGINGFAGVLYDNRDRAHSLLPQAAYPRLARLSYGPALKAAGADRGLAGAILFPAVVFGNSSTAVTAGPFARSLPRLAMTADGGPAQAAQLYLNNHLYVYPEHRDHDAVDRYPANWPYMVISQGSSRSDRPFLQAIAATLAAFPEDTFEAMRRTRLVAPTLQMILRRNMAPVRSAEAYFTGIAHPVAFDGDEVSAGRMIAQAGAMRPGQIPPLVTLAVEEETFGSAAGLAGLSETLFDTPAAIARVWRGPEGEKEMTLSAAGTEDPFGRVLRYRWVLLRGEAEKVQITPLDAEGSRARIRLGWHDPYTEPAGDDLGERLVSRVDIGVFAEVVGTDVVSAPSFVSVSFPGHQARTYGRGASGPLLLEVDYTGQGPGGEDRMGAFDPIHHWVAPWTDRARYDGEGTLLGWRRTYADGREEEVPLATGLAGQGPYGMDQSDRARPVLTYTLPTE